MEVHEPKKKEWVEIRGKLRNNKTPEQNSIISEEIKYGSERLKKLWKLLDNVWENEKMPEQCPLLKEGDATVTDGLHY